MVEKSSAAAAPEAGAPAGEASNDATTTDGQPITPLLGTEARGEANPPTTPRMTLAEAKAIADLASPPTPEEAATFAAEFMVGELMKAVTARFKTLAKAFIDLREHEQHSILLDVRSRVERAVARAVELIQSNARVTFPTNVDSVTFKDGVKVVLKVGTSEHAHLLADQAGKRVTVVIEDMAVFMDAHGEDKPEPDQRPLFDQSRSESAKPDAPGATRKPRPPKKKPARTASKGAAKKGKKK